MKPTPDPLIGQGVAQIDTPALVIDLDAMERNIARLADFARRHGMTQRRWQNAVGLLRMARVITDYRRWVITDLASIEQRLELAKCRAIEAPESYQARLNRHARHA